MNIETSRSHEEATPPILRAILHSGQTATIIGYNSETRRLIHSTFRAHIQVSEGNERGWGRILTVRAQPVNMCKAWRFCAEKLAEDFKDFYELHGFGVNFFFPTRLIELFLLRGVFVDITKKTKVSLLVKHACLMRSTERVVRFGVSDTDEASLVQFKTAVYLLAQAVQENIIVALCMPDNVWYSEKPGDNLWVYCKQRTPDIFIEGGESQQL